MAKMVDLKSTEGNTNLPLTSPKKRINVSKRFIFTWLNYPTDWKSTFEFLIPSDVKWICGEEICPDTGTPHLQGYLEFPFSKRPSCLKLPKQIHWEIAKGNKCSNIKYCVKDGKVHGNLPYDKPLVVLRPEQLYDWQTSIYNILETDPDDRKIHWIWEATGGRGKSAFVKFAIAKFGGILCSGKAADCKYLIVKFKETHGYYPRYIFYDVPRKSKNYVSYSALEEIKNGCFASTKYECECVLMNSPHIICFANFEPDYDAMSIDRWDIMALG